MGTFRRILVPIDFGDATQPAIDLALSLAKTSDAEVTLVHAFDLSAFFAATSMYAAIDVEPILEGLGRDLKALCEKTRTAWPRVEASLVTGRAFDVILDTAKTRGCDLIVIGTHGRRGVARALLGSVAEKIVRLSPIPVLTVHPAPAGDVTPAAE